MLLPRILFTGVEEHPWEIYSSDYIHALRKISRNDGLLTTEEVRLGKMRNYGK